MPILFDRDTCRDLNKTISREWLTTNGLGGYAAGTVAGVLTRLQHGLLVTVPPTGTSPHLLLAKIDEEVAFDQRAYYLGTNEYKDGTLNPAGFVHLETFSLDEGVPTWKYRLGGRNGCVLEKRIWMPWKRNTTCIQYRLLPSPTSDDNQSYRRASSGNSGSLNAHEGMSITLLPLTTYRPHDAILQGNNQRPFRVHLYRSEEINAVDNLSVTGCTIQASDEASPYHVLAATHPDSQVTFIPTGVWYWNFWRRMNSEAGLPATDDLYLPGVIRATLRPGSQERLSVLVSTEELTSLAFCTEESSPLWRQDEDNSHNSSYPISHALPLTTTTDPQEGGEDYLQHLLRAANHFLAYPASSGQCRTGREPFVTLYNAYFTLQEHTRDALIALPGLMLVTGRHSDALNLLYTLIHRARTGLLPDFLSRQGQHQGHQSADTTLWLFYALDYYLRTTHHYAFLEEHFNYLQEALNMYIHSTTPGIYLDQADGLISAHRIGEGLTWMNATVDGLPVTPRAGKAVEINALWYHALSLMEEWSRYLLQHGKSVRSAPYYRTLLERCKISFHQRFWNAGTCYLYDVVDGPEGHNDASLRPNQLLAFSLRYPVLDAPYCQQVFEQVTRHLLTPYGLRTLAPTEQAYRGRLSAHYEEQQQALHQGSCWPWLLGPYIDAMLAIDYQVIGQGMHERLLREYLWRKGLRLLEPFQQSLHEGLLGMCPAVLNGDPPHQPGHIPASALSIAELLRIYDTLARMRVSQPEQLLC